VTVALGPLDAELTAAAREVINATDALARARGRRDRALAPYVNDAGMTAAAASLHARAVLLNAGFTDLQVAGIGVSAETIRPAARHARTL